MQDTVAFVMRKTRCHRVLTTNKTVENRDNQGSYLGAGSLLGSGKSKACIFSLFSVFLEERFLAHRPTGILNLAFTQEIKQFFIQNCFQ